LINVVAKKGLAASERELEQAGQALRDFLEFIESKFTFPGSGFDLIEVEAMRAA